MLMATLSAALSWPRIETVWSGVWNPSGTGEGKGGTPRALMVKTRCAAPSSVSARLSKSSRQREEGRKRTARTRKHTPGHLQH